MPVKLRQARLDLTKDPTSVTPEQVKALQPVLFDEANKVGFKTFPTQDEMQTFVDSITDKAVIRELAERSFWGRGAEEDRRSQLTEQIPVILTLNRYGDELVVGKISNRSPIDRARIAHAHDDRSSP